jgi:hypothetical protein
MSDSTLTTLDDWLRTMVCSSLQTAVFENGYIELLIQTPLEVATDIIKFDASFEPFTDDPEKLVLYVTEWLDKHKSRTPAGDHDA